MPLFVGIDVGTSGIRAAAINEAEAVVALSSVKMPGPQVLDGRPCQDATIWWETLTVCLNELRTLLSQRNRSMQDIAAVSVDGTSGTMLLTDRDLNPVTPAFMYNSGGFDVQAQVIAANAPVDSIVQGPSSGLARLLFLQHQDSAGRGRHLLHQADWIAARLMMTAGLSDETNSLKTGFDVIHREWPAWMSRCGAKKDLLPTVSPVGAHFGTIASDIASEFGFADDVDVMAGTTDSNAAFLASGASKPGDGVTSLGTTLAIKLLASAPVADTQSGVYSHRIGDLWLPGGASNSGGGALLQHFSVERMNELEADLQPDSPTELNYYPLPSLGERFPIADPNRPPQLSPRPTDDAVFLQGLLEGISRIEKMGYERLEELGAGSVERIFTSGGGAQSTAWTKIRQRMLKKPMLQAASTEAAVGTARIAAGKIG